ncbi:MAG TPA: T9SS type A sorting domain-containing protein [Flavobacteriales bacterium]|nr:T9SS type A sorting domain-containing protein [Flavobacteriales bacterium]
MSRLISYIVDFKRFAFSLILLSFIFDCPAQISVLPGTQIVIQEGSTIELPTGGDSLILFSNSSVVNNGHILLGNNTHIKEHPGFPIVGTGYESSIYLNQNFPLATNLNGLGITITNNSSLDTLSIQRHHIDTLSGMGTPGILRYYELKISEGDSFSGTIVVKADSTELNSISPTHLNLFRAQGGQASVKHRINTPPIIGVTDTLNFIGSTLLTLGEFFFSTQPSQIQICYGDTINLTFNSNFPISGELSILFIDSLGNTINIDTILFSGSSSIQQIIEQSVFPLQNYNLVLSLNNIGSSDTILNLEIFPPISILLANIDSLCENSPLYHLNGSPSGGVWSGNLVQAGGFDPSIAGPGQISFLYTYIDAFGCVSTEFDSITILTLPQVSSSADTTICANSNQVFLVGSPIGGVFSGLHINNNTFSPQIGVIGLFDVIYSFTNEFGCTNHDTSQILVNPIPDIPSIILSSDTLFAIPVSNVNQWYFNSSQLIGDTLNYLIPNANGQYLLITTNEFGCSINSEIYDFSSLMVSDIEEETISIFPNPSAEWIFIRSNITYNLKIIDSFGKQVYSTTNYSLSHQINVNNLTKGCYFIILESENGKNHKKKIVVQ